MTSKVIIISLSITTILVSFIVNSYGNNHTIFICDGIVGSPEGIKCYERKKSLNEENIEYKEMILDKIERIEKIYNETKNDYLLKKIDKLKGELHALY